MINLSIDTSTSPMDAWSTVTAMSLHFNSERDYDAFKFSFKGPRCKRETFEQNKNRFQFEKLARKYPYRNDIILYSLANLLSGEKWIGNFTDVAYDRWKAKMQNVEYTYKEEMKTLIEQSPYKTFDEMILPKDLTDVPYIYKMVQGGNVSIETITILNIISSYTSDLQSKLTDPLGISSELTFKVRKYTPFLRPMIDINKYAEITRTLWFTSVEN
jgi:hypothetical protein